MSLGLTAGISPHAGVFPCTNAGSIKVAWKNAKGVRLCTVKPRRFPLRRMAEKFVRIVACPCRYTGSITGQSDMGKKSIVA